uniref:Uncharacterized protein n=1 Tax=Panagrolaimus davidi TaxID=227884 RepID=A0A914PXL7_9BILA
MYKHNKPLNKALKLQYTEQIIEEICGFDNAEVMKMPSEQVISVAAVASSFLNVLDDSNEDTPEPEELRTKKEVIAAELTLYFQELTIPRDA